MPKVNKKYIKEFDIKIRYFGAKLEQGSCPPEFFIELEAFVKSFFFSEETGSAEEALELWRELVKKKYLAIEIARQNQVYQVAKKVLKLDTMFYTRVALAVTSIWLRIYCQRFQNIPDSHFSELLIILLHLFFQRIAGLDWDIYNLDFERVKSDNFLIRVPVVEHIFETLTLSVPIRIASPFLRFLSLGLLRMMQATKQTDNEHKNHTEVESQRLRPVPGENLFFLSRVQLCVMSLIHWISIADKDPWQLARLFFNIYEAGSLKTVAAGTYTELMMQDMHRTLVGAVCAKFSEIYAAKDPQSEAVVFSDLVRTFEELRGSDSALKSEAEPVFSSCQTYFRKGPACAGSENLYLNGTQVYRCHLEPRLTLIPEDLERSRGFFVFDHPYRFDLVFMENFSKHTEQGFAHPDLLFAMFGEHLISYWITEGSPRQSLAALNVYINAVEFSADALGLTSLLLTAIFSLWFDEQTFAKHCQEKEPVGFNQIIVRLLSLLREQLAKKTCPHLMQDFSFGHLSSWLMLSSAVNENADTRFISLSECTATADYFFDSLLRQTVLLWTVVVSDETREMIPMVIFSLVEKALAQIGSKAAVKKLEHIIKELAHIYEFQEAAELVATNLPRVKEVTAVLNRLGSHGIRLRLIPTCGLLVSNMPWSLWSHVQCIIQGLNQVTEQQVDAYISQLSLDQRKFFLMSYCQVIEFFFDALCEEGFQDQAQRGVFQEDLISLVNKMLLVKSHHVLREHGAELERSVGALIGHCYTVSLSYKKVRDFLFQFSWVAQQAFCSVILKHLDRQVLHNLDVFFLLEIMRILPAFLIGTKRERPMPSLKKLDQCFKHMFKTQSIEIEEFVDTFALFALRYMIYGFLAKKYTCKVLPPDFEEIDVKLNHSGDDQIHVRLEFRWRETAEVSLGTSLKEVPAMMQSALVELFKTLECSYEDSQSQCSGVVAINLTHHSVAELSLVTLIQRINHILCGREPVESARGSVAAQSYEPSQEDQRDRLLRQLQEKQAALKVDYLLRSKHLPAIQALIDAYKNLKDQGVKNPVSRRALETEISKLKNLQARLTKMAEKIQDQAQKLTAFLSKERAPELLAQCIEEAQRLLSDLEREQREEQGDLDLQGEQRKTVVMLQDAQTVLERLAPQQRAHVLEPVRGERGRGLRHPVQQRPVAAGAGAEAAALVEPRPLPRLAAALRVVHEPNQFVPVEQVHPKAAVLPAHELARPSSAVVMLGAAASDSSDEDQKKLEDAASADSGRGSGPLILTTSDVMHPPKPDPLSLWGLFCSGADAKIWAPREKSDLDWPMPK